ncbi:ATP-binding protein, partial [Streptomyces sp. A7024]
VEPPPHPVVLSLLRQGDDVVIAVFDPGGGVPQVRESGPFAESGRGLHVVSCLSDAWGWSAPGPYGKAVWARFSPAGPGAEVAAASGPVRSSGERAGAHEDPLDRLLVLVEILTGSTPARLSQAEAA